MDFELTQEQSNTINVLNSGVNVFVSGEAGTGKSTIINEFLKQNPKKSILTFAPTGIAAIQIKGVTLHRGFKLDRGVLTKKNIYFVPDEILVAETIIIDEISMCRIDVFEAVVETIKASNKRRARYGLAPTQLILVGDFFQLPPVVIKQDADILKQLYPGLDTYFAFNSPLWNELNLTNIVLHDIMRQNNLEFTRALNKVRIGDSDSIDFINANAAKNALEGAVVLTGMNRVANEINAENLGKIERESYFFQATIKGRVSPSDLCVDDELELKEGARVMTVVNGDNFQNGSIGTIISINKKKKSILIVLDNGEELILKPYEWEVYEYETDYDTNGKKFVSKKKIGSYKQFPLKLAYAITIHKSQGQTFEKMNLMPYSWDYGQLYVALSRAKSLEGLHLLESIKPQFLKTSNEVVKFYDNL